MIKDLHIHKFVPSDVAHALSTHQYELIRALKENLFFFLFKIKKEKRKKKKKEEKTLEHSQWKMPSYPILSS